MDTQKKLNLLASVIGLIVGLCVLLFNKLNSVYGELYSIYGEFLRSSIEVILYLLLVVIVFSCIPGIKHKEQTKDELSTVTTEKELDYTTPGILSLLAFIFILLLQFF